MGTEKLRQLREIYPINPEEVDSFFQALTHSSWANEVGNRNLSNERLEFLGDAVLGYIISEYLFINYPDYPEGILTRLKSELVRERVLAELANQLRISELLRLGAGARNENQHFRPSVQADAIEAIIGWLTINRGLDEAKSWVLAQWQQFFESIDPDLNTDYKGILQEQVYKLYASTPEYQQIACFGPPHDRQFEVVVEFGGQQWGSGESRTKKAAEQKAAKQTLQMLADLHDKGNSEIGKNYKG